MFVLHAWMLHIPLLKCEQGCSGSIDYSAGHRGPQGECALLALGTEVPAGPLALVFHSLADLCHEGCNCIGGRLSDITACS